MQGRGPEKERKKEKKEKKEKQKKSKTLLLVHLRAEQGTSTMGNLGRIDSPNRAFLAAPHPPLLTRLTAVSAPRVVSTLSSALWCLRWYLSSLSHSQFPLPHTHTHTHTDLFPSWSLFGTIASQSRHQRSLPPPFFPLSESVFCFLLLSSFAAAVAHRSTHETCGLP